MGSGLKEPLTLPKQAKTQGIDSLGPSTPGMKSMRGPIRLNGWTVVNSTPFSALSAAHRRNLAQSSQQSIVHNLFAWTKTIGKFLA